MTLDTFFRQLNPSYIVLFPYSIYILIIELLNGFLYRIGLEGIPEIIHFEASYHGQGYFSLNQVVHHSRGVGRELVVEYLSLLLTFCYQLSSIVYQVGKPLTFLFWLTYMQKSFLLFVTSLARFSPSLAFLTHPFIAKLHLLPLPGLPVLISTAYALSLALLFDYQIPAWLCWFVACLVWSLAPGSCRLLQSMEDFLKNLPALLHLLVTRAVCQGIFLTISLESWKSVFLKFS